MRSVAQILDCCFSAYTTELNIKQCHPQLFQKIDYLSKEIIKIDELRQISEQLLKILNEPRIPTLARKLFLKH